jgi:molybdopterin-biosynthesis enzyme MoeA-like protein
MIAPTITAPTTASLPPTPPVPQSPDFGLIIVGDEILSGKRADKHMAKVIELLSARGLQLAWATYVADSRERITEALKRAFACGHPVFSTGGIGATPDDHTRQCAAAALGVELALHPEAEALIRSRMQDVAREQGIPYEADRPDNIHRLNMGVFPVGAQLIPNPYNKIPGFTCLGRRASADVGEGTSAGASSGASSGASVSASAVHFVPGFPVMAWPMIEWLLDTRYASWARQAAYVEHSVIVFGAMEATLTPLMEQLEADFVGIKVFSLPSVDHPQFGRHIELGVKGTPALVAQAYPVMLAGLHGFKAKLGPELVR